MKTNARAPYWGIAVLVPFVPFVYVLTGNDFI